MTPLRLQPKESGSTAAPPGHGNSGIVDAGHLALKWSDWDTERGLIYIRRTYSAQFGFGTPKSAQSTRAVGVTPELGRILQEHKEGEKGAPDDLMFVNREGNVINHQNMVTREFHPALQRAGVKRIRFHDLRHTYATLMISLGENIKFIQRQMGHSTITTTMDRYGHLLPEASEGVGARLDSMVFSKNVIPFPKQQSVE